MCTITLGPYADDHACTDTPSYTVSDTITPSTALAVRSISSTTTALTLSFTPAFSDIAASPISYNVFATITSNGYDYTTATAISYTITVVNKCTVYYVLTPATSFSESYEISSGSYSFTFLSFSWTPSDCATTITYSALLSDGSGLPSFITFTAGT